MLQQGDTVIITEQLEEAFRMNGWSSYNSEIHDEIKGKIGFISKIEPKYSHDYCYVKVKDSDTLDFSLPVCALTKLFVPNDEMCELIAEFSTTVSSHPSNEEVKEWFRQKQLPLP